MYTFPSKLGLQQNEFKNVENDKFEYLVTPPPPLFPIQLLLDRKTKFNYQTLLSFTSSDTVEYKLSKVQDLLILEVATMQFMFIFSDLGALFDQKL